MFYSTENIMSLSVEFYMAQEEGKMLDLILFTFCSSLLEGQVLPLNEGEIFCFPCLVSFSAFPPMGLSQSSPVLY